MSSSTRGPKERAPHPAMAALASGRFTEGIDPFALFCAYHLGLFPDGRARFAHIHDVARAFSVDKEAVERALTAYALTPDDLVHSTFDVASAQADVQVSPPGVDLFLLARMHFDALTESYGETRDWERELADDAAENARVFGARDDDERR